MSRYTCWNCRNERDTDNVVAVCAMCFARLKSKAATLREVIDAQGYQEADCADCERNMQAADKILKEIA